MFLDEFSMSFGKFLLIKKTIVMIIIINWESLPCQNIHEGGLLASALLEHKV